MSLKYLISFIVLALLPFVHAQDECAPLGISFAPPRDLATSAPFTAALTTLTQALEAAGPQSNSSFSVQLFSTSAESLLQFQHTSPAIASGSIGVKTVDANTVFRVGSISKLFTIFLFQLSRGRNRAWSWEDPITKFVPELAKAAGSHGVNEDNRFVRWQDVTLGDLASHLSGITRDNHNDLSATANFPAEALGFTKLNETSIPKCGQTTICNRKEFLAFLSESRPLYGVASTPVYTNAGYQLLGYALGKITGKSYPTLLNDLILKPLGMTGTSFSVPKDTNASVIPGDPLSSFFGVDLGDETPVGGLFSTTTDVAKLGQAIIASKLLTPTQTRRWLKPNTLAEGGMSLGMPWEIVRRSHENRFIDIYTKSGNLGAYNNVLGLLPEYGVGFVVLTAGPDSAKVYEAISNQVIDALLPALETAGREDSTARFAGTYSLVESGWNSSLTIEAEAGKPGLRVSNWIANGADMLQSLAQIRRAANGVTVRLYPSFPPTANSAVAEYRSTIRVNTEGPSSPLYGCITWATQGAIKYGQLGLEDIAFKIGEDGRASSILLRALRLEVPRAA